MIKLPKREHAKMVTFFDSFQSTAAEISAYKSEQGRETLAKIKHAIPNNYQLIVSETVSLLLHHNILYSKKFLSAKNFVKRDHQAVRQEVIFVKRRSSLICSPFFRSSLFCLPFISTFTNVSDPTLLVCEKNLVRN